MSIFDHLQKTDNPNGFNKRLSFDETSAAVTSGKAVYKGNHLLGILTERREHNGKTFTGEPKVETILTIASFENPTDIESLKGKLPDGEVYDLFAHDDIVRQIDAGKNGNPVKIGDLILIKCNGKKRTTKGNMKWDFEVYIPDMTKDAKSAPAAAPAPVQPPVADSGY